jgi:hypothetical protein
VILLELEKGRLLRLNDPLRLFPISGDYVFPEKSLTIDLDISGFRHCGRSLPGAALGLLG